MKLTKDIAMFTVLMVIMVCSAERECKHMKNFVEKKLFLKVITGKIDILKHVRNLNFWTLALLKYVS